MKKALLSFDIEEFDFPRERGEKISLKEGVAVSKTGLERILKVLAETDVKATFFVTGNFAKTEPMMIRRMVREGHEIAAHGVDHFVQKKTDIKNAKKILEKITRRRIYGWRQPRMQKIDYDELRKNGYKYDSSVNPAFIPGRYNNSKISRKPFLVSGILEIPASVATIMRVPLFWLSLHLFPFSIYVLFAKMAARKTGYFVTYAHPWEFSDALASFKIVPWYIKHNSGVKLEKRLTKLISSLKESDFEFTTYKNL